MQIETETTYEGYTEDDRIVLRNLLDIILGEGKISSHVVCEFLDKLPDHHADTLNRKLFTTVPSKEGAADAVSKLESILGTDDLLPEVVVTDAVDVIAETVAKAILEIERFANYDIAELTKSGGIVVVRGDTFTDLHTVPLKDITMSDIEYLSGNGYSAELTGMLTEINKDEAGDIINFLELALRYVYETTPQYGEPPPRVNRPATLRVFVKLSMRYSKLLDFVRTLAHKAILPNPDRTSIHYVKRTISTISVLRSVKLP